ncbi:MAG: aminotransferase DegT [Sphingomonas sp. 28-66-16]|nr:MAG: aminotransferase DegT [Sphingomonas sp. 28-66-16]
MTQYPLIAPRPPRLSDNLDALRRIEQSGVFSNNGPEVRAFEQEVTDKLFGGSGASLAVGNATLGLMIAIRQAAGVLPEPGALALMPSLTFAATAQAAIWAGLTPLICDIDPLDWAASAEAEERLLRQYGSRISVIIPYATFGNAIDLDRYETFQRRYNVGVVVDAAASLGTIDEAGRGFGADSPFAIVHSMHATKTFSVGEGGLIHSGNVALIETLRAMSNFGFQGQRSATLPGINAKLPEILGLMARLKLAEIDEICDARSAIEATYRAALADFDLQRPIGRRRATQFMPVLVPEDCAADRPRIIAALAEAGIGCGQYFSPHLAEQPWFKASALIDATPHADAIARRMLSLPITDAMAVDDARIIAGQFIDACRADRRIHALPARPRRMAVAAVTIIGGGPAGTALLTAASKHGRLPDLARSGLIVVDRDSMIGGGRLGHYAITSDSTAQTFLTAVKDNPEPALAALIDHPAARTVANFTDALGVPLVDAGPLLRATGEVLAQLVVDHGGAVMTGHEVLGAQRTQEGQWTLTLRARATGRTFEQRSETIVVATGGHQPLDRLAVQKVAGLPLSASVGDRLLQSDEVLGLGGLAKVGDLLAGKRNPRIAVIGGSTSAVATVALLLKTVPALPFGAGAITLLHRRPLRPFYHSVAAAEAEGFTDFGPDDICPVSGFVYRLAGFRLEARELVLRMLAIDGRAPDPRVRLHRISGDDDAAAQAHLLGADLVIAALGYRPYALPLRDVGGEPIPLAADRGDPMVDRHCRIVGADGTPVPGAYGIGLAAGFVPWGPLGGEASFTGQANGLWLWQNDVGMMIVDQILGDRARAVA